jgi:hypothetical protein
MKVKPIGWCKRAIGQKRRADVPKKTAAAMSPGKMLLYGGLAFGAFKLMDLLNLGNAANRLKSEFLSVKVHEAKLFRPILLKLSTVHTNPSGRSIKVDSIVLDAIFDGKIIGKIREVSGLPEIPGNTRKILELDVEVPLLNLIGPALSILQGGAKGRKLQVTGEITADGITVPYNQVITFS